MTDVQKKRLVSAALKAARRAYCPYSGFRVGAALLGSNGRIYTGCNVENASYGLTICAERAALCAAVASGVRSFRALAVAAGRGAAAHPCGACRQALAEFCPPEMPVFVTALDGPGNVGTATVGELLPHSFKLQVGNHGGVGTR